MPGGEAAGTHREVLYIIGAILVALRALFYHISGLMNCECAVMGIQPDVWERALSPQDGGLYWSEEEAQGNMPPIQ